MLHGLAIPRRHMCHFWEQVREDLSQEKNIHQSQSHVGNNQRNRITLQYQAWGRLSKSSDHCCSSLFHSSVSLPPPKEVRALKMSNFTLRLYSTDFSPSSGVSAI
jgi:hypothetical protein